MKPWHCLTYKEKAGSLVWSSFENHVITEKEISLIKNYKPSGFILFRRNLLDLLNAKVLINSLLSLYDSTPFICIDEEGGKVSRLPEPFIRGKNPFDFVKNNDINGFKNQLLHQIFVAKGLKINLFLAPVSDILTEINNPVMIDRCLGQTANDVIYWNNIAFSIFKEQNFLCCAKHFPGHGNTTTDSHKDFASSSVNLDLLQNREWLPFKNAIKQDIKFIMTAHVLLPEIDAKYPATLSSIILQNYLQKELGFNGIILSDDLRMNAIAYHYKQDKKQEVCITENININEINNTDDFYLGLAAIDALKAGCDVILSCKSIIKEEIIYESIAQKLEDDSNFDKLCQKKYEKLISIKKVPLDNQ